jgi:Domain of unknown function (DUF4148)
MNTQQLIAAAALAFIGSTSAFAQEATADAWMNASVTKSRAEVQAELAQARKDGTIKFGSAGYIEPLKVSKTRAEVVAATLAARDSGEIDAINGEVYEFNARPAVRLAKSAK